MPEEISLHDAVCLHQEGRLREAAEIYGRVLQSQPNHSGALHLLGVVHHQQGDHSAAIKLIGRAIAVGPRNAVRLNNFALALHSLGRFDEALTAFRQALEINRNYPRALGNQARTFASVGRHTEALASYQDALQLDPHNVDTRTEMALLLEKLDRNAEAVRLYEEGVRIAPCLEFHVNLGCLHLASGGLEAAIEQFERAVAMDPDCGAAHFNLASACQEIHRVEKARQHFARAAALRPESRLWRLRAETCGPAVLGSTQEIETHCRGVESAIERALHPPGGGTARAKPEECGKAEPVPSAGQCGRTGTPRTTNRLLQEGLDDMLAAGVLPGFIYSYLGRDQRRLKEQFAELYEPYFRGQTQPRGSRLGDRKRIGILLTRRHEGMFLQSMEGIVSRLDRRRWEIVILASREIAEALRTRLACEGLRFAAFGDSLGEAIEQVRATACDLIYYWEVGSDAMNYFLPFARLAPVQCTGWGSTITSGVPAVDYFLSSELVERPGSESQYTERLWKSRTLFRYQDRLPATTPATPADFALPEGQHLFVCFQNPLKLHPDVDPLLAGVLEADPRALVVLLADRGGHVARLLKERFSRRIPRMGERIVFLPPQRFADYCRLLQLADVILDTPHYGAGSSCYDLFSYNLPVVTWPGELIVGRITQACYRKMGLDDLVVQSSEEYVGKAVQVATDRDYRYHLTERIAGGSNVLFNDLEAVREHERFFEEAVSIARSGR